MMDDWVLMETLGMGGYSKVKMGLHKKSAERAALKIMFADHTGQMSKSKKQQLLRELNVMKKVNHPNVIKLISFNEDARYPEANGSLTPCIMTALELATGGELFDYLMYTGHFDDAATRSYFKQLIDGLDAMHTAGIAHRDLKPENLLVDHTFTLKIADFGFATEFMDDNGKMSLMKTPCGTKNYLAPEFWKGLKYSYKCDIFAAGIILFTVYAGFPPFMEAQPKDWWWDKYSIATAKVDRANQLRRILKENPDLNDDPNCAEKKEMAACLQDARKRIALFWKAHSKKRQFEDDDFKDIALNLIHPDPARRMEIKQIVQHKWFTKGPFYNSDELKYYLSQRVKIVLRRRVEKIRNLMQNQGDTNNLKKRAVPPLGSVTDATSPLRLRMNEIDAKFLYDESLDSVKDELFPDTMTQFVTHKSPADIAVRIERAAVFHQAKFSVKPKDNLIVISCGISQPMEMPDGAKITREEQITFCVKQFFVSQVPTLKDGQHLFDLGDEITYLVIFKRLQGTNMNFSKIAKQFMEHRDIRDAIDLSGYGVDSDDKAAKVDDDQKDEQ